MKFKSIKNLSFFFFQKAKETKKLFLILLAAFVLIIPTACKDDNSADTLPTPPPEYPKEIPVELYLTKTTELETMPC